jgi:hypothetical protein
MALAKPCNREKKYIVMPVSIKHATKNFSKEYSHHERNDPKGKQREWPEREHIKITAFVKAGGKVLECLDIPFAYHMNIIEMI